VANLANAVFHVAVAVIVLRAVRAQSRRSQKASAKTAPFSYAIAMKQPEYVVVTPLDSSARSKQAEASDKRKVFVVFGRNTAARNALFTFLRAIDLAPIEWGQAIAMTGHGTPYIGDALDRAFSNAQGAVVLLTGDDMTRLGKRYLQPHDPPQERNLTPQARQNVLFEAGMAFGKYPERTVLVTLGALRLFSDIEGRHVVRISNAIDARQHLMDRLQNAGCLVDTKGKTDWHTEGDFDAAVHDPDVPEDNKYAPLKLFKREAQFAPTATYKRKIWIHVRNETSECLMIRDPVWKPGAVGIRAQVLSGTLQIKLGGTWCPEKIGLDRIHVPAGELCQLWVEPGEEYSIEELQRMCQSETPLGVLKLRVNDTEIEVPV
jgi:predicted nucleotide-binding protein